MKESEMKQIAAWIDQALKTQGDTTALGKIRASVKELCGKFPLYQH
jgi:glycine hydroxymethyltransferase